LCLLACLTCRLAPTPPLILARLGVTQRLWFPTSSPSAPGALSGHFLLSTWSPSTPLWPCEACGGQHVGADAALLTCICSRNVDYAAFFCPHSRRSAPAGTLPCSSRKTGAWPGRSCTRGGPCWRPRAVPLRLWLLNNCWRGTNVTPPPPLGTPKDATPAGAMILLPTPSPTRQAISALLYACGLTVRYPCSPLRTGHRGCALAHAQLLSGFKKCAQKRSKSTLRGNLPRSPNPSDWPGRWRLRTIQSQKIVTWNSLTKTRGARWRQFPVAGRSSVAVPPDGGRG